MTKENYDYKLKFIIKDQETQRQHISLTERTMSIIKRDMVYFNRDYYTENRSGFLNKIFQNYYLDFPLSPKVILSNITRRKIEEMSEKPEEEVFKSVVNILHRSLMKDAINIYKNNYSNEESFKFRLNQESLDIMESYDDAHFFQNYAPRGNGETFFLKMIFESYASLPAAEREKIFFKDEINLITKAIKDKTRLNIKINDEYVHIVPVNLNNDVINGSRKLSYFKAISERTEEGFIPIEDGLIYLYEIQGVKSSHPLNDIELSALAMAKSENFSIVLHHKSQKSKHEVKVKFSRFGLERFRLEEDNMKIVGIPVEGKSNIRVFEATESEIFWELFKYGSQAKILEPDWLIKKFKAFYEHAAKQYSDNIKGV